MANIKYRSLQIKFIKMGKKGQPYFYFWLFKNKKKFKLIGRYFPHHFQINGQFIRVSIIDTVALNHYLNQGAICKPKIARLFQGLL